MPPTPYAKLIVPAEYTLSLAHPWYFGVSLIGAFPLWWSLLPASRSLQGRLLQQAPPTAKAAVQRQLSHVTKALLWTHSAGTYPTVAGTPATCPSTTTTATATTINRRGTTAEDTGKMASSSTNYYDLYRHGR